MTGPSFARHMAALPATVPFVGPEQQERERGRPFAARLGANENGFGPSPRAVAAMQAAAAGIWRYGDPTSWQLRSALASRLGLDPAAIVVGEGIDGLLGLTARLMLAPGDVAVTSDGAYPTFSYHVAGVGGRLVREPYRGDRVDAAALAAAAQREGARIVYLANPDNPMGGWLSAEEVRALRQALPAETLLCLDEAYAEFAPEGASPPLDAGDRGVLRFRTFSKAHGLAGLRIGYALGHPDMVAGYERIRNHFAVSRMAQAAALAALEDTGHLARTVSRVADARVRLTGIAAANGLAALPSAANFVAIDCGRDGAFAKAVLAGLLARDVFVRMPGVAPLDRCIRVSCGPEEELALFDRALPGAIADACALSGGGAPCAQAV